MPVFLDNEPLDVTMGDLAGVIEAARQRLADRKRIIVEVSLNGEPLVGEALANHANEAVGDQEVRLVSAEPGMIASETLTQLLRLLEAGEATMQQTADHLQRDDYGEAMKLMTALFETWQSAPVGVYQSAELVGIAPDSLRVGDKSLTDLANELVIQLRTVRDLLENRDTLGLADVLAYEMPDTAKAWKAVIEELLDRIEDAAGGD